MNKNGSTKKLWVKGERHDHTDPKFEELATMSGATGGQGCKSEVESTNSIPYATSCKGITRRSSRGEGGASCR